MVAHCHKQIRDIAKAIAGELYEKLMGSDEFWSVWKKQNPDVSRRELERLFIERNWGRCIGQARQALVMVLKDPNASEKMKEEVMDVLEKDASLMRGRIKAVLN